MSWETIRKHKSNTLKSTPVNPIRIMLPGGKASDGRNVSKRTGGITINTEWLRAYGFIDKLYVEVLVNNDKQVIGLKFHNEQSKPVNNFKITSYTNSEMTLRLQELSQKLLDFNYKEDIQYGVEQISGENIWVISKTGAR